LNKHAVEMSDGFKAATSHYNATFRDLIILRRDTNLLRNCTNLRFNMDDPERALARIDTNLSKMVPFVNTLEANNFVSHQFADPTIWSEARTIIDEDVDWKPVLTGAHGTWFANNHTLHIDIPTPCDRAKDLPLGLHVRDIIYPENYLAQIRETPPEEPLSPLNATVEEAIAEEALTTIVDDAHRIPLVAGSFGGAAIPVTLIAVGLIIAYQRRSKKPHSETNPNTGLFHEPTNTHPAATSTAPAVPTTAPPAYSEGHLAKDLPSPSDCWTRTSKS